MQLVHHAESLRRVVRAWRAQGLRVGFVPTMGNLHAGHYSLVALARRHADRVVASVFVNPTQFGPNEDFARYPRTLEQDRAGLEAQQCDLLFAPAVEEIYPYGPWQTVVVSVPVVTASLEGASRPGHFDGVATVVSKLFSLVQPDVAVFGRKDYQQLLTIRRLVRDLGFPIELVDAPTLRESSGLAMSSRNQYLSAEERERAAVIYATLRAMREALRAGRSLDAVEAEARLRLEAAGLRTEYAVVRRAEDLGDPAPNTRDGLIGLVAGRLGSTRLIDNLVFDGV